jgi:uncharacterized protein (DUF302 family)
MKQFASLFATALIFTFVIACHANADSISPRDGWAVHDTAMSYKKLLDSLKSAIKAEDMFIVTEAGPTRAAKKRGITIPGNRVVGVYRNDYAVRALATDTAAMIEAPIRFYVTENDDDTATLSYKLPSFVFAPYLAEGGEELSAMATELDTIFSAIADRAVNR